VQNIEADTIRHAQVGDDHVEGLGAELADGRRDAVRLPDEMAAMPQQECEGRTRGGLVVHDQDSGHASGRFTFGASAEVRKSAAWEVRAEEAVFQDGTPEFRFELL
jgi:hypothetical protein